VNNIVKDSIVVLFLALSIRAIYAIFFVEPEYLIAEDQILYIRLAQQISESGFLGLTTERVPGYPLFLSTIYTLFGKDLWNVVLVQIFLDSLSCVLVGLTAHSVFGRGILVAGVLSAINLNMIILSSTILTDTLFLFLFILFIFSLLKYLQNDELIWFVFLVLFILMATLVRPLSYYLLFILPVGLLWWKLCKGDTVLEISKLVLIYIVLIGVLLGGIHKRNFQQYNSTEIVSQTGRHVLGWVVPAVYQYSGQGSYQEGKKIARERLVSALHRDNLEGLPLNPFESSSYQTNVGKEILFEFGFMNVFKAWVIGSTINLLAPSVAYAPALRSMEHPSFYRTNGDGVVDKILNYIKNSSELFYIFVLTIGFIISLVFVSFALLGVFRMASILPTITVTTLLFLVVYFLIIAGPIIGVKYRLPVEPVLILFSTYFLNGYFLNKNNNRDS
jgi:4-amino-4-deoxy-L-arabinose transferase-like glycosyltransferase